MHKSNKPAQGAGGPDVPEIPAELQAPYHMHQQNQLNAGFARKCLAVATCATIAFLCTLPVIGGLAYAVAHPPVKYFATVNGTVVQVYPTDVPAYTDADVLAYGEKQIRKGFTVDFKNYREQISAMQDTFTKQGYVSYYNSLTHSNLFSEVTKDRMIMTPDVTRTGMIKKRGRINNSGPYIWEVQYPVTLSLDGQNQSLPAQPFIFTLRIQRADVRMKSEGLELSSIVTGPAKNN
ncbi:DotI/IcmL/TraM family protein [Citrobacter braakii]|uniref:DotI/IcmL/TraM family protein n=1 Tax=Citrobacter braakii TaxID=57706 RepID=UPI004039C13C